jgi:hypothetical protein
MQKCTQRLPVQGARLAAEDKLAILNCVDRKLQAFALWSRVMK